MKLGRLLAVAAALGAGCGLTGTREEAELAPGQSPVLSVSQLDHLDLGTIREIFSPDQAVTVVPLEFQDGPGDPTLGGMFAYAGASSVAESHSGSIVPMPGSARRATRRQGLWPIMRAT